MLPKETDFATTQVRDFPAGISKFNLIKDQLRIPHFIKLQNFQLSPFNFSASRFQFTPFSISA